MKRRILVLFVMALVLLFSFAKQTNATEVPAQGEDSAYTLTEVSSPSGNNVITRYEYNAETGDVTAKYYRLDLKKTEYGTGENSTTVNTNVVNSTVPVTAKYDDASTKTYDNNYTAPVINSGDTTITNAIFNNISSTTGMITAFKNTETGNVEHLNADFINNSITLNKNISFYTYDAYLISNRGTIGDVNGNFVNNNFNFQIPSEFDLYVCGSAFIGNKSSSDNSSIGNIKGNFINNSFITNLTSHGYIKIYGALFVGNYAFGTSTIGDINSNFIGNNVNIYSSAHGNINGGGYIGNWGNSTIGNIKGDFVNNNLVLKVGNYESTIEGGGFIGNYASSSNEQSIGDINSNFIDNTVMVSAPTATVAGGGIIGNYNYYNSSQKGLSIGNINGDFINNKITVSGKAIVQGGTLIGNYTYNTASATTIGDITGDFINNSVEISGYSSSVRTTGLIGNYVYNSGNNRGVIARIGKINANFYNNNVTTYGNYTYGGIITNHVEGGYGNYAVIDSIQGEFINNGLKNTYSSSSSYTRGGAIYSNSTITNGITDSLFRGNYVDASGNAQGGAIYVSNYYMEKINADFINNYASSANYMAQGGAIYLDAYSLSINGDFIGNHVQGQTAQGGAVYANRIHGINGIFSNNYASSTSGSAYGGALYLNNYIFSLNSNYENNYVTTSNGKAYGGAIYNNARQSHAFTGDFIGNHAQATGSSGAAYGGAVYNTNSMYIEANFKDNYAKASNGKAYGGAIYNAGGMTISNSTFSGNYDSTGSNAIYNTGTVSIGYNVTFDDKISGSNGKLNISGKNIKINNTITGNTVNLNGASIKLGSATVNGTKSYGDFDVDTNVNVTANSFLNIMDNEIRDYHFNNLTIADTSSLYLRSDLDFTGSTIQSDRFVANTVSGNIIFELVKFNGDVRSGQYEFVSSSNLDNLTIEDYYIFTDNKTITIHQSATSKGYLDISISEAPQWNLKLAVDYGDGNRQYDMNANEEVNANLGFMQSENSTLVINGNNYSVNGNGKTGIIVNDGQTLHIANVGSVDENGNVVESYNGFTSSDNGAVVQNKGTTKVSNSVFTNNVATQNGGVIYNEGTLNVENAVFKNNGALSNGGAIYNGNYATISSITGIFENNYVNETSGSSQAGYGGAIYNFIGTIGDISASFIGNYVDSTYYALGGAISNYSGSIGNITGYFENNYVQGCYARGGAILVQYESKLGDINANFVNNYASSTTGPADGGAIYMYYGTIGDITGNFDGNHVIGLSGGSASGGAITNRYATIGNITGNFKNNYTRGSETSSDSYNATGGGAIFGYTGNFGNITGEFVGNNAEGNYAIGGAIYNFYGHIGNVQGIFKDNHVSATNVAQGGAIAVANSSNYAIDSITADFTKNYAIAGNYAQGGAIYNVYNKIGDIKGNFISNYAKSTNDTSDSYNATGGGAIYNSGSIDSITGSFKENYAQGNYAFGGAIYNKYNPIGDITGEFKDNYAIATGNYAMGGALYGTSARFGNITGNFTGNYAKDTSTSSSYGGTAGGAISMVNGNGIGAITGDFTKNYALSDNYAQGGAIFIQYSSGGMGNLKGNFIQNYAKDTNTTGSSNCATAGGAAYLNGAGTMQNMTAYFEKNYVMSGNYAQGGALYMGNGTSVNEMNANFVDNNVSSLNTNVTDDSYKATGGGALVLRESGRVTKLVGSFQNNYVKSENKGYGGAVYMMNGGTIAEMEGGFYSNYVDAKNDGYGGAVYGQSGSTLGKVTGDFVQNYVKSNNNGYGGAVSMYQSGTLGEMNGNFYQNYVDATNDGYGGAIYIQYAGAPFNKMNGAFIENYVKSGNDGYGGAVYAKYAGVTQNATIDFVRNYIQAKNNAFGGAVYIAYSGGYNNLTGLFLENYAYSENASAYGGALYMGQGGNFTNINATFKDNYVSAHNSAYGGALYLDYNATIIGGAFLNNHADSETGDSKGGAIYFNGQYDMPLNLFAKDSDIVFSGNKANNESNAIHNRGGNIYMNAGKNKIVINDKITGENFTDSSSNEHVATININDSSANSELSNGIVEINNTVSGNTVNINGGVVKLGSATVDNVKSYGDFSSDVNVNLKGGELNTVDNEVRDYHVGTFKGGSTDESGVVAEGGTLAIDMKLSGSAPKADRYNVSIADGKISFSEIRLDRIPDIAESAKVEIFKGTNLTGLTMNDYKVFTSNRAVEFTQSTTDKGYLEYVSKEGTFNLKDAVDYDKGNRQYDMTLNESVNKDLNDMMGDKSSLTINGNGNVVKGNGYKGITVHNGQILYVNDTKMTGFDGDVLDNKGTVYVNAKKDIVVFDDKISGNDGIININGTDKDNVTSSGTVVINNAVSNNTVNMNDGTLVLNSKTESGAITKADLSNSNLNFNGGNVAIKAAGDTVNLGNLKLNNNMNVSVDTDFKKGISAISADNVDINDNKIIIANVNMVNKPTEKKYTFELIDNNASQDVKDKLTSAIEYKGTKEIKTDIYKYTVSYDDTKSLLKVALPGGGKSYHDYNPSIFAAPVAAQIGGYLTLLNSYDEAFQNMDMYMLMPREVRQAMKFKNKLATANSNIVYDPTITRGENKAGWFRPYATFENIHLKNGPRVSNVAYGTFVGTDSELKDLGHGWEGMWNAYVGYNGSHQAYNGISIYQNGGTLGTSYIAYKGNFFTGLTVNVGANAAEASTNFGTDNFSMLMAGVASKSGYNIEFFKGKFIVQPSYMMSYSFVNTFDYTNAAGVRMDSDALHAIQIEPGIKFIANLKHGWQPYMGVSMVWNIMDKTRFMANDISLPDLSIRPFVKYGVGIRKLWGESFTGLVQAYLTNGGRNGIGLQIGGRWLLGKKTN